MNKAVFGLVAAALQLVPGSGKADEPNDCSYEKQNLDAQWSGCFNSGNASAGDCLNCLQACGFVSALQGYEDCLGSQSLESYTNFYKEMCNILSGGLHETPPPTSSG